MIENVKWGLIGAGDIAAKRVAPALADVEGSELVAIARRNASKAKEFAEASGASEYFADWREMCVSQEVDAVYIATPVYLHAEQTIAAANAGKHVLCEKPMALDPSECREMIAAAASNGVKLGVAYYRHFYPVIRRIKELLANGAIGKVSSASIEAFEPFDPPVGHSRHWLVEKEKSGGGPMMDFGCHRIEVLADLLGAVTEAKGISLNESLAQREVEDTASAIMRHSSGAISTLSVSHAVDRPADTLSIHGTTGSIKVDTLNSGGVEIVRGGVVSREVHPPHANLHQPLIEDMVRAIIDDREPTVPGETGLAVAEVIEMIYS